MAYLGQQEHSADLNTELKTLESVWIAAEARADRAKLKASRAERAAADLNFLGGRNDLEVGILIGEAERLAETRDQAEAEAKQAFEKFWNAKSSGA